MILSSRLDCPLSLKTPNMGISDKNPRQLTFSQAQGYEELPQPLALGEISDDARRKLWDMLAIDAWDRHKRLQVYWYPIFVNIHSDLLKIPLDEFTPYDQDFFSNNKALVLRSLPFNRLFDLFQMIMRHPDCPPEFTMHVANIFSECRIAYVVDTQKPVTILPAATEQEGVTLMEAIEEFRQSGLRGTEAHLRKAAELINKGEWPDSVRESIHAVESVARQLDPAASKTLGPALASLEKAGQLHPALKKAFISLYGYTSDEEGIRHPLIANPTSPVSQDEAVFMLGACASFASYLWRRQQTGN